MRRSSLWIIVCEGGSSAGEAEAWGGIGTGRNVCGDGRAVGRPHGGHVACSPAEPSGGNAQRPKGARLAKPTTGRGPRGPAGFGMGRMQLHVDTC